MKVRIVSEKFTAIKEKLLPAVKIRKSSWILVTTLGVAIASGASAVAMKKIDSMGALTWSGVLYGCVLGSMQWLVLRDSIELRWWLLATALGSAPALAILLNVQSVISTALKNDEPERLFLVIFGVVVGLIFAVGMAVMQWLVLRERVEKANRWVGDNLTGWWIGSVGGASTALVIFYLAQRYVEMLDKSAQVSQLALAVWPAAIGGLVAGAIAGTISWRAVRGLLPRIELTDQGTTEA